MPRTQLAAVDVYEVSLAGFVVVALLALLIIWLGRADHSRIIRFGFFLEHKREAEEENDAEAKTRIWPGEQRGKESDK